VINAASYPMGAGGSSAGLNGFGREPNHSNPSSVKVKNGGAIPPHHPTRLNGERLNYSSKGQIYLYLFQPTFLIWKK
jgi:hypothetical protein